MFYSDLTNRCSTCSHWYSARILIRGGVLTHCFRLFVPTAGAEETLRLCTMVGSTVRNAPKPPLCKGRCRPCRAAEGLFPSGGYSRAASDYELLNSRAVRSETVCVAAIPQSATLTAPFTQRGPCAVRQCVPFPLAAQVRQWGSRGSPASAGSGDGRCAPKPPLCKGRCRPCRAAEGLMLCTKFSLGTARLLGSS